MSISWKTPTPVKSWNSQILYSRPHSHAFDTQVSENWQRAKLQAAVIAQMCLGFGITHVCISPCYPNPFHIERVNKNLKIAIRIFHSQNQMSWDQNIHWFQLAFNTTRYSSTGNFPANIFLRYQIRDPLQLIWNEALQNFTRAHAARASQYNASPTLKKVGDYVMCREQRLSHTASKVNALCCPYGWEP